VQTVNRNGWYLEVASEELATLTGPRRSELETLYGKELIDENADKIWPAMIKVLKTGEHCPHHLRGQKPWEATPPNSSYASSSASQ